MTNPRRNVAVTVILLGTFLTVTGCAARRPAPSDLPTEPYAGATSAFPRTPGPEADLGAEGEDVSFLTDLQAPPRPAAIPIESNERVEHFVRLFTGPQRAWIQRALERSGRYRDRIWEIFREEGLPEELVYLALIESGYNPHAYSRSGAVGIWQFMEATGRRYGLVINWWVDERRDPEKSTRAAARYLKDLYTLFEDWNLAAAAYNAGEGKLKRGLEQYGTNCYWSLSQKRYLKRETREYVPRFLAVLTIARDPPRYGFNDLQYERPLPYETVAIHDPMDLAVVAKACGADLELLKKLNPQLHRGCTPPDYGGPCEIQIPRGSRERFTVFCAGLRPDERLTFARHRIRKGETLSHLARRYGVSVESITSMNRVTTRHRIREGQEIIVPLPARYMALNGPGKMAPPFVASRGGEKVCRVRQGDTLWGIARRHGVSVDALRSWNRLANSSTIHPGQKLAIRKPGQAAPRSVPVVAQAAPAAPGAFPDRDRGKKLVYRVQKGDTLWGIANQYGVSSVAVAHWNGLTSSANIHPGQTLDIWREEGLPAASAIPEHTVQEGDTLWQIARRYGISLADLCRWNNLDTRQPIQPGLRLHIAPRSPLQEEEGDLLANQCAAEGDS